MSWLAPPAAAFVPLGYAPFLAPLPLDSHWLLLVPLVVLIAVVYKAIKVRRLDELPRQATVMASQILAFMVLAAALLWLIVELV